MFNVRVGAQLRGWRRLVHPTGARAHLTAAQALGTMQILRSDRHARMISPTVGLLYLNSSVLSANLYRCHIAGGHGWGIGQSCALAKEIFFQQHSGGPVRATRSRSKAASYLSVELLGNVPRHTLPPYLGTLLSGVWAEAALWFVCLALQVMSSA